MNLINRERVLVVGVGAMGCLFAARLAAAGFSVSMLGNWPEALLALQSDGVKVLGENGITMAYPVHASSDPAVLGRFELALVLVKSWQTNSAARRLAHCLSDNALVLTLQNGLGNREILAAILGEDHTAVGVTTTGASLAAPGVVIPSGAGTITLEMRPLLDEVEEILKMGDFAVARTADLVGLQWGKLVINSAINPLTAILNVTNGELIKQPAAHALLTELALETAGIAYASGISLPYPDPAAAVEKVAELTSNNISSMLQDVRRGSLTEIDAINGAVSVRAAAMGISAPLNWSMWQLVQSLFEMKR